MARRLHRFTLLDSCARSSEHLLALLFLHDLSAAFTPATPPPGHSWQRLQHTPAPDLPTVLAAACEACTDHWGSALDGFLDDIDFAALDGDVLRNAIEQMTRWPVTDAYMMHPLTRLAEVYQVRRSLSVQQAQGAFFTPFHVAAMMATIAGVEPEAWVLDPTCGAAVMLIAALEEVRERHGPIAAFALTLLGVEIDARTAAIARASLILAGAHPDQFWIGVGNPLAQDIVGRDRTDGELKPLRPGVVLGNPPFGKTPADILERGAENGPLIVPTRVTDRLIPRMRATPRTRSRCPAPAGAPA